ncbi:MAG TPA: HD domain-containing protein [Candidatus Syntrophosphaera sp.]|jgi:3'-5' exoribonuclease|nr:MAG: 3'-5' exoribonuclease YhaM [Candidatus Cloacimonetes bacterium ADurb.Bin117]HNU54008.1 HD domain-containing protein [Candidatus Syntrophosphaera sp.]HOH48125.1 HD domain-containing protein [Candidatus Syntrophosphaera sp.]HPW37911.1 HD domain-containing protein [Candidatus Syntrophosphaera sp.]HPX66508.1 HD domain-containing protein [Candidatus Syntrophosphaera sp.]
MTDHIDISELKEYLGKEIQGFYLVAEKELRDGRNDQYLRLRLQDRSGTIAGNVWKDAKNISESFSAGDVVHVKALVNSYKEQIQLNVSQIRFADYSEYRLEDFVTRSKKDPDTLAEQFFAFVDKVENIWLHKLLQAVFGDKEIFSRFLEAPAAKSWHHNYMHGLIEHTVSVATLCDFVSVMYPVNRDLLLTGALLHDFGKIFEYNTMPAIDFTEVGRLIGHLSLSDQYICEQARMIAGFPDEILLNLRHMILAHHGEYEKASVRLPQTIEALVLHLCDNLDAQSVGVAQMLEAAPENAVWSEYDKLNNRYYHLTKI